MWHRTRRRDIGNQPDERRGREICADFDVPVGGDREQTLLTASLKLPDRAGDVFGIGGLCHRCERTGRTGQQLLQLAQGNTVVGCPDGMAQRFVDQAVPVLPLFYPESLRQSAGSSDERGTGPADHANLPR